MSQDSSITDAINKTPVLTVFQPASTVGIARFGQWLASEGAILNTIDLATQPVPAYSELNSDGIIILGGPMGANDGADYPWMEPRHAGVWYLPGLSALRPRPGWAGS